MESFLHTLQEELKETLELTKNSTPRDYKFPEAKNMIKVAIGKNVFYLPNDTQIGR